MLTFSARLDPLDGSDAARPVEATVDRDRLTLRAGPDVIGDWSLAEVRLAQAVDGFDLDIAGRRYRLTVEEPHLFDTAITATEQTFADRVEGWAPWWKFWSIDAWRTWRSHRRLWAEYRGSADTSALVTPARPVSPIWAPVAVLVFLIGAIGAGGESEEVAAAAPPTTSPGPSTVPMTVPSTTTSTSSTASSSSTTTTTRTTTTTQPEPTTTVAAPAPSPDVEGELRVYFFDVGQGDSTLLAGPDFTILVDAGRHDRSDVVGHLNSTGIDQIDLLVGTHPHADHIGQFPEVLSAYPVTEVWMSGDSHTTATFERALDAIEASNAGYHEPRAGESYDLGSVRLEVVSPAGSSGDLNNGSVALSISYGNVAFLFTGDAEESAESAMLARGHALEADVLHVGHHGSSTSSSDRFLSAVDPQVAVYSAGSGNQYGHPHPEVIARLEARGIEVYGTDIHGTVVVTTDGSAFTLAAGGPSAARSGSGPSTPTAAAPTTTTPENQSAGSCQSGQVDINTAATGELERIKHIGPERAGQILQLRPFTSVDSMSRIRGIAEKRLADIKAEGIACVG